MIALLDDLNRYRRLLGKKEYSGIKYLFLIIFYFKLYPNIIYRLAFFFKKRRIPVSFFFSFLNLFLFGIEIRSSCRIGGGLFIAHTSGVVIGAASIGENFTIFQNSTLGALSLDLEDNPATRPTVGNNVTVSANCLILGNIVLPDGFIAKANRVYH